MTRPSSPHALQEEEYWFPYHYVARSDAEGFRQTFNDSWGINYLSTIDFMVDELARAGVRDIVDVGCGDGRLTRELALRPGVQRVVGIDASRRAIALAHAMNAGVERAHFRAMDITAEPWTESPFQCAILMEVLEHIPPADLPAFVEAVRGLLVPGGRLLVTVPHANMPVEAKHFQHFTSATLASALERRFVCRRVVPFEKRGWQRRAITRLLQNRFFILNHRPTLAALYRWYKNHLFHCAGEAECQRLFVEAVAS